MIKFRQFLRESKTGKNLDVTLRTNHSRARIRDEDDYFYLSHVRTKDDHQGQGHGHEIMKKVNAFADEHKKTVKLVAVPDHDEYHEKLVKFYNKHGYIKEPKGPYMVRKHQ